MITFRGHILCGCLVLCNLRVHVYWSFIVCFQREEQYVLHGPVTKQSIGRPVCFLCSHSFLLLATLWGDKVSVLTHTYPHKPLRKIEVAICSDEVDSPFYCARRLTGWFASKEQKYSYTWHWMSLLRPGAPTLNSNSNSIAVNSSRVTNIVLHNSLLFYFLIDGPYQHVSVLCLDEMMNVYTLVTLPTFHCCEP